MDSQTKTWLEEKVSPIVIVRTSPDVEKIAGKNGLRFIDMIKPFEKLQKTSKLKKFKSKFL